MADFEADLEVLVHVEPLSFLQVDAHAHHLYVSEILRCPRNRPRGIVRIQRDTFRP